MSSHGSSSTYSSILWSRVLRDWTLDGSEWVSEWAGGKWEGLDVGSLMCDTGGYLINVGGK